MSEKININIPLTLKIKTKEGIIMLEGRYTFPCIRDNEMLDNVKKLIMDLGSEIEFDLKE